jgi:uncharacterized membrane protein YeaQ/YmgE (transglycosylase-associated protein family)
MLRESFSEQRSLVGCLVPVALGVVGGGLAGYWSFRLHAESLGAPALGMEFLAALVGGGVGLFLGALFGFVLDRVMTRRQRREEEF